MPVNVPIIGSGPSAAGGGSDFTLGSTPVEPPAGDYTVPSNLTSSVILIDNTAAGRDIDFPVAMDANGLYVIVPKTDPNTNPVTVSVNGTLQYTINQPNGAVGLQYLSEISAYKFVQEWDTLWEIDPTTNEITAQLPLTVVAAAIESGTDSTSYTKDQQSDYTNLQPNISWAGGGLRNDVTEGTNYALSSNGTSLHLPLTSLSPPCVVVSPSLTVLPSSSKIVSSLSVTLLSSSSVNPKATATLLIGCILVNGILTPVKLVVIWFGVIL